MKAETKKANPKDDDMLRESSGKLRRVMEVSFLSFNFVAAMVRLVKLHQHLKLAIQSTKLGFH